MSQERRQYYRIEQDLAFAVQTIDSDKLASAQRFEVSPYFFINSEIRSIREKQLPLLEELSERDPVGATLFNLVAQQIDAFARSLTASERDFSQLSKQPVDLSEGGMMYNCNERLELGQAVEITLVFPEPKAGLTLYGKVQRVLQEGAEQRIAIAFEHMPESCRSLLAREVLAAQSQQLQQRQTEFSA